MAWNEVHITYCSYLKNVTFLYCYRDRITIDIDLSNIECLELWIKDEDARVMIRHYSLFDGKFN